MKNPVEPAPLIVAAAVGGAGLYIIRRWICCGTATHHDVLEGVALGVLVQVMVRLTGVS